MQDNPADVRVLFLAGWGRSGSTILDMLLGRSDGLVSVGEIKFIWQRGLIEHRRCGCGTPIPECPFWTAVISEAFGTLSTERVAALEQAARRFRTRHLPAILAPGSLHRFARDLDWYRADLLRLYRAIQLVSGAEAIVDSSKYPAYLFGLRQIPEVSLRVAHVVRDPRAVAYSWQRDRPDPDAPGDARMPRLNPAVTGLYWSAWNTAIERITQTGGIPRRQVRYEDLVADPDRTVADLVQLAEVRTGTPGGPEQPAVAHLVSGNPVRLTREPLSIRLDDAWRTEMPARDRWLAELTSAPVRRRYGY